MRSCTFTTVARPTMLTWLARHLVVLTLVFSPSLGSPMAQEFLRLSIVAVQGNSPDNGTVHASPQAQPAKTVYVESRTVFVKRGVIQAALEKTPELGALNYALSSDRAGADLLLQVDRPFLTFDWTYTIVDRLTKVVLCKGKVVAVGGKSAARLLSEAVVRDLEAARRLTDVVGAVTTHQSDKPSLSTPPGTPIEDGQAARQILAEQLRVPLEQIRVVEVSRLAPDHRRWHTERGVLPDNSLVLGDSSIVLVSLDPGLGNKTCALFRVLFRSGDEEGLADEAKFDAESQAMTDKECRSVAAELEHFSSIAFDFQRGPERFEPFLATALTTDVEHTSEERNRTPEERRLSAAQYLDFFFLAKFAAIEISPSSFSDFSEQMDTDFARLEDQAYRAQEKGLGQMVDRFRKNLADLGLLRSQYLKAMKHFLQKAAGFSLFDKHIADGALAGPPGLSGGTMVYHVMEGAINFLFIWEGKHLTLVRIECAA